jgi:hypothetical protein
MVVNGVAVIHHQGYHRAMALSSLRWRQKIVLFRSTIPLAMTSRNQVDVATAYACADGGGDGG